MTLIVAHARWNEISVVTDEKFVSPDGDGAETKINVLPHLGAMVFGTGLTGPRVMLVAEHWRMSSGDVHDLIAFAPDVLSAWWAAQEAKHPERFAERWWTDPGKPSPTTTVYVAGQAADGVMRWWRLCEPEFTPERMPDGDLAHPTLAAWGDGGIPVGQPVDTTAARVELGIRIQAERADIVGGALWEYTLTDGPCFHVERVHVFDDVRRPRMQPPPVPMSQRLAAAAAPR